MPYETDLFASIVRRVGELAGCEYGKDEETDRAMRIVAEHGRAVTFLVADGVLPSNEGRGYLLRRVLRRAALFGRTLGLKGRFLTEIAEAVVGRMGHVYPELVTNRDLVMKTIDAEEARFAETLGTGLKLLHRLVKKMQGSGEKAIAGEDVFKLFDTCGENGLIADLEGFEAEMEKQRERARAAHKFRDVEVKAPTARAGGVAPVEPTEFIGYTDARCKAAVLELHADGISHEVVVEGQQVEVVRPIRGKSPEGGGR